MQNYSLEKLKLSNEELVKIDSILKKDKRSTQEEKIIGKEREVYSENQHSIPQFNTDYYGLEETTHRDSFKQNIKEISNTPTARAIDKFWDVHQFDTTHSPVLVSRVEDRKTFSLIGLPRCSHLPVKMMGQDEFRIPNEYLNFKEVLTNIFAVEKALNPNYNQYYAYLTIDQRFVPKGNSQRIKGAHVDGIPRDRNDPNSQIIDHCYIVSDSLPTLFYLHPFPQMKNCSLNEHDFCQVFDYTKDDSKTFITEPFCVYLMNAYSVHSAIDSNVDVIRTFLRLEFSTLIFDREGNSQNPYFDYNWEPRQCHRPPHLIIPDFIERRLDNSEDNDDSEEKKEKSKNL